MIHNLAGGPTQPQGPISCSSDDKVPLSKGELTRIKKKRKKDEPIAPEDEPNYVKKVEKERKAEAHRKEQMTAGETHQESEKN